MELKYKTMKSLEYSTQKKERMEKMKKLCEKKAIKSPRDYLVISNSVHGQKRIASRDKINRIIIEKAESINGK